MSIEDSELHKKIIKDTELQAKQHQELLLSLNTLEIKMYRKQYKNALLTMIFSFLAWISNFSSFIYSFYIDAHWLQKISYFLAAVVFYLIYNDTYQRRTFLKKIIERKSIFFRFL